MNKNLILALAIVLFAACTANKSTSHNPLPVEFGDPFVKIGRAHV